jgi:hypothetical protein
METMINFVLAPLYVAGLIALVASAFKAPKVFQLIATPLYRLVIVAIFVWTNISITMGTCSVSLIRVVADIDPKAALAAIDRVQVWMQWTWVGAPLILTWVVLSATKLVRDQLDREAGVEAANGAEAHRGE